MIKENSMRKLLVLTLIWQLAFISGAAILPDGFYFEKNDHILTPSEELYYTFRLDSAKEQPPEKVEFQVKDLADREVASGYGKLSEKQPRFAVYRLLRSNEVCKLPTGWYDLAVRTVGTKDFFHQKFFIRNEKFQYRAVCLFDSVNPEGFLFWCNEPADNLIEPLRSFPVNGQPDLVIVSCFTRLPEERFQQLERFVADGGTALFFGVNHQQMDNLNPFIINRKSPFLRPGTSRTALINAIVAPSAELLEESCGHPLIARKRFGKGWVIAAAAGIKPGELYRDMIKRALNVELPERKAINLQPDKEGFREGASRENFGRFGYVNNDGLNVVYNCWPGWTVEDKFSMWFVAQDYFNVSFSGKPEPTNQPPRHLETVRCNWLGKQLRGKGGRWGSGTDLYLGLGTPGVLFRNQKAQQLIFESPMLGCLAWPKKNGTGTLVLEEGNVDLATLSSNWLLIWKRTDKYDAWPLLLVFNRRVSKAEFTKGRLVLSFAKPGIDFSVIPLGGLRHYTPDETSSWMKKLPEDIAQRCTLWSRRAFARTIDCHERYKLLDDENKVLIRNEFEYLVIPNDWNVKPLFESYLPPLLPLYAKTGFAELPGAVDLHFATYLGPLFAIPGKRSEYLLTIPDLNYTLPTSPTDPQLDAAANRALFERICEHLDVVKLLNPGVNYSIIKNNPHKKELYPERELHEACSKHNTEQANNKYIDLHRTLAGVTGNLMFKPYLDAVPGHDEVKQRLNAKIVRNVHRDINFFQYKMFLRYRQEPFTGFKYLMGFMAPVRYNDGYWIFHDMNETCGIFAQTLALYSRICRDRAFFEENEPFIDLFMSNFRVSQDFGWMASCALENGVGNNIDMLNAELPGWAGVAQIKHFLGKEDEAGFARYMAARAGAAVGTRLIMADYFNTLNFPIPPHVAPMIHEMAGIAQAERKRNQYLPLGVSHGYGEGWPSLWPTSISLDMLGPYACGKDFYSTSKGVPIELLNFYKSSSLLSNPLLSFEEKFYQKAYQNKRGYFYSRIAGKMFLQPDRKRLETMLGWTMHNPAGSARQLSFGRGDWEVSAMVIILELLRQSAGDENVLYFGDEKSSDYHWESAKSGMADFKKISRRDQPDKVADGEYALLVSFPAASREKTPVVFTRFDTKIVAEKPLRTLKFQVKAETRGTLSLVLPSQDWSRRATFPLQVGMEPGKWQKVTLNLEDDFKIQQKGIRPDQFRGELFVYNKSRASVKIILDALHWEK